MTLDEYRRLPKKTLGDLAKLTHKQIKQLCPAEKCKICGQEIQFESNDDPGHTIGEKLVCEDCYYTAMGDEIEKHPLGIPRMPHRS